MLPQMTGADTFRRLLGSPHDARSFIAFENHSTAGLSVDPNQAASAHALRALGHQTNQHAIPGLFDANRFVPVAQVVSSNGVGRLGYRERAINSLTLSNTPLAQRERKSSGGVLTLARHRRETKNEGEER